MILAGDVGGTHTRLALFSLEGKCVKAEKIFSSPDAKGLEEIIRAYIQEETLPITKACIGIAGPVRQGVCQATNLPWIVNAQQLSTSLQIPSFFLINDLEANAYGIQVLKPNELFCLQKGSKIAEGNQALIAAGTGLGEAGLVWDGKKHHPFACEGGHCDFAPRNEEEIALFQYVKKTFAHVSYERLVSGPGLQMIYRFLIKTNRFSESKKVQEEMMQKNPSSVISEWGKTEQDPACSYAVNWFLSLYGAEAGNLALKLLAVGGLYIGGGIVPHLLEKIKEGKFVSSFCEKGRFRSLLETIPIWVILNENTALLGAAHYAACR